jgi:hypothetical protein
MSYNTSEDRIREEQVRRLSTDEDPRGSSQHWEEVYTVELKPKKAKIRDRAKEERLRIKILDGEQASD